jgi:TolB-like protein/Tfp pilus assembly protein PilF
VLLRVGIDKSRNYPSQRKRPLGIQQLSFLHELKRRSVFRVSAAYLAGAWLLIEVAGTLFPVFGIPDWGIRFMVIVLVLGLVPAIVFSWVYELTPEGLKRDKGVEEAAPPVHETGKKLDRIIIALLVLALGYFALDKFVFESEPLVRTAETAAIAQTDPVLERQRDSASTDKSIAVLPFTNMSPNLEDDYFSDGLTEELIAALAKVDGLHVTARTSAFAFKGVNLDIRDVGDRLNVKTVLEGSVRREQNHVRVTTQLINVQDGYHLWSGSYDYELKSVLSLQETISRAIVGALRIQLSSKADEQLKSNKAVNPEAYDLYLKGRYYGARLTAGGLQQSIEAFQKAITIEPGSAPSHAGLANAFSFAGYFGVMPPRDAFPQSIMEADIALTLDPESSEALIARGMACLMYEWDWNCARDELRLALELSPNFSMAHWAYAEYLMVMDPPAALSSALRALALDPLSFPIMNLVAFTYLYQEMFAEAIRMDEEMIAMNPTFAAAHWNLGIIHTLHGRFEEAEDALAKAVEYSGGMPSSLAMQAYAYAKSGDEASAREILAELESRRQLSNRGYVAPVLIAHVYEGLGKTEDAINWLEKAVIERDGWLVFLNAYPRFESLRGEPRFQDVLNSVGLPAIDQEP